MIDVVDTVPLFLDAEFTDLHQPRLISLGLVDVTGQRRFYAELSDTYQPRECCDFVQQYVLPQLEGTAIPAATVTDRLKQWIQDIGRPAMLWSDSPSLDFRVMADTLFRWPEDWPVNLRRKAGNLLLMDGFRELREGLHIASDVIHHALADAERNQLAWIQSQAFLEASQGG